MFHWWVWWLLHLGLKVMFIISSKDKFKIWLWFQTAELIQLQEVFDVGQIGLQRDAWKIQKKEFICLVITSVFFI